MRFIAKTAGNSIINYNNMYHYMLCCRFHIDITSPLPGVDPESNLGESFFLKKKKPPVLIIN